MIVFHWLLGKEHFRLWPSLLLDFDKRTPGVWQIDAKWLVFQLNITSKCVSELIIDWKNAYEDGDLKGCFFTGWEDPRGESALFEAPQWVIRSRKSLDKAVEVLAVNNHRGCSSWRLWQTRQHGWIVDGVSPDCGYTWYFPEEAIAIAGRFDASFADEGGLVMRKSWSSPESVPASNTSEA